MKLRILALLLLATPSAFATPITVSDQKSITTSGQNFDFNFVGLPATGTAGQFSITLNGDYSGFTFESAVVTADVASGNIDLGDGSQANGIISNSIAGLSLNSYSITTFGFDDVEQSWIFDISDSLFGSLLADGSLTATVQNDSGVNPFNQVNPDFVRVGYSFSSNVNAVPAPATLPILGLGLLGFAFFRRRIKT